MYAWLWRHLPGTGMTRLGVAIGLFAVVGALLWYLVFPWIEPKIQFDHGTVGGDQPTPARTSGQDG
jgi:hypothetical protein